MIDVYATLRDQYSLEDLKQQTTFLSKKERQKEVVRILREYANVEQQDVRNYLEKCEATKSCKLKLIFSGQRTQ